MSKGCEAVGWNGEVGFAVFCVSVAAVLITYMVLAFLNGRAS